MILLKYKYRILSHLIIYTFYNHGILAQWPLRQKSMCLIIIEESWERKKQKQEKLGREVEEEQAN